MKTNNYYLILLASFFLASCSEDFFEATPTDSISTPTVVATTGNAIFALNGIHKTLYTRPIGSGKQSISGIGAHYRILDEMGEDQVFNANKTNLMYNYTGNDNTASIYTQHPWQLYYKIIANANIIIGGIDNADGSQHEKDWIKGQALTYRAWSHFRLVQQYAKRYQAGTDNMQLGIPIKLTANAEELPRSPVEDVYTQINIDLNNAIPLLENYNRLNKSHINSNVAKGIKARVALVQENWDIAISMAQQARSGHTLIDADTYKLGFRINATELSEIIWASIIIFEQTDKWGNFGGYMSRNFSSSNTRDNPRSINKLLYDQISNTDVRKTLFDESGTAQNLPPGISISSRHKKFPYTSQKFIAVSSSDSRVDLIHLRAAEMFLIEAEALAKKGSNDMAAQQVLYDLLSTRDPSYIRSTLSGLALQNHILVHRRIELWGEGFRFFDLKRLNSALDRTNSNHKSSIANVMNIPAGDSRWQMVIPQDEINSNSNMEQNPR